MIDQLKLGTIKKVNLRNIWKNEASDFTPWLAKNIDLLGEALGLELELENIEVNVGPFSADILAKDSGTGKFVVIENQLTKTNHSHLGQCITYAAVLDASAVIWIASKFTDQHKKALDWLNDHTTDDISFYGLVVELIQIDNSPPALKFNIVSQPNTAVRQASNRNDFAELTPSKRKQLEFWTHFRERLQKSSKIRSLQAPRAQYWYDIALGKSGIHLSNTFNTDRNELGVRVYIHNKKANDWFPYFLENKNFIEEKIGEQLNWEQNPNNKDKVISLTNQFNLEDEEERKLALDWMIKNTLKFNKVFRSLIKKKKEEK